MLVRPDEGRHGGADGTQVQDLPVRCGRRTTITVEESLLQFGPIAPDPEVHSTHVLFQLLGSAHGSYFDAEVLVPQVAGVLGLTSAQLAKIIGTINPARAITVESAYVEAFFDQHLRHHPEHLLDGPSLRFPEMVFVP
jgi:hypothetical protein